MDVVLEYFCIASVALSLALDGLRRLFSRAT